MREKKFSFLIEEKDLKINFLSLLKISDNNSTLLKISQNQSHHSDKNVYNNINLALENIINEKN